ncbi:hypothetical protein OF83DRAFT_1161807 [Amylostereum chailletii]|nr:hypothetical protein OF83DRAFT_1161807 [Amylostereum chailletii]
MHTSKLHLKRTPTEQAEHDLRKARKAARRHSRRPRADDDGAEDDNAEAYGPPPAAPSPSFPPDTEGAYYEEVRARVEEERFREKMYDAMNDDSGLHGVEARLNDYARVPHRWRTAGSSASSTGRGVPDVDPCMMEDEEYAEWVRAGMWRRKNAAAIEEQERVQAAQKARQAEAARVLKAKEEKRGRRRRERVRRRDEDARLAYERGWEALGAMPATDPPRFLRLDEIPWPIFIEKAPSTPFRIEHLTAEAISAFLLPVVGAEEDGNVEGRAKERKERLRRTMLRFHPDKFESRVLRRVDEREREAAREGMGAVVRTVQTLMGDDGHG